MKSWSEYWKKFAKNRILSPQYERNGINKIRRNSNMSIFRTIYERNNAVMKFVFEYFNCLSKKEI